jgi:beta-lactamase regulating signal transducer with metallopeptidase domain
MIIILEKIFHWEICELILSALLFLNYKVFVRLARNAWDRYSFLKISFALLLVLPWVPIHFSILSSKSASVQEAVSTARAVSLVLGLWHLIPLVFALTYLFWFAGRAVKLFCSFRDMRNICSDAESLDRNFRWPVLLTDREDIGPMTVGVFSPKVVLQRRLFESLSSEELGMVLAHEFTHADRRDGFFNLFRLIVKELLAFSPFVTKLSDDFEENMELSVDLKVLSAFAAPRAYAELILRLSEGFRPSVSTLSAAHLSKHFVAKRILSMKEPRHAPRPSVMGASVFAFLLLSATGVSVFGVNSSAQTLSEIDRIAASRYEVLKFQCNHGDISCQYIIGTDVVYQLDNKTDCHCKPPVGIEMFQ